MKSIATLFTILIISLSSFGNPNPTPNSLPTPNSSPSMSIKNQKIKSHKFLSDMYTDEYYPKDLVKKIEVILLDLCTKIESTNPRTSEDLFALTHAATEKINEVGEEFYERDSEIETVARDTIGMDFDFIAKSYGFEVDVEELIAPRDW